MGAFVDRVRAEAQIIGAPQQCSRHGDFAHALVHESGHALSAIEGRVPFFQVGVHQCPVPHPDDPDLLVHGGVIVDLENIGTAEASSLLIFALAGQAAEHAVLKHRLDRGWIEDVDQFRRFTHTDEAPLTDETLVSFAGRSMGQAVLETQAWANDRVELLEHLATSLASGRVFTFDQVVDLVDEIRPA